jgi:hypothetical protein
MFCLGCNLPFCSAKTGETPAPKGARGNGVAVRAAGRSTETRTYWMPSVPAAWGETS